MTTELNNNTPIDVWRAAKEKVDNGEGYRERLGCVGEPISDVLDHVLDLLVQSTALDVEHIRAKLDEAANEARGNLLDLVNDSREAAAEKAVEEVHSFLEIACISEHDVHVEGGFTMTDVAQLGVEHAAYLVEGHTVDVSIDDDELGTL